MHSDFSLNYCCNTVIQYCNGLPKKKKVPYSCSVLCWAPKALRHPDWILPSTPPLSAQRVGCRSDVTENEAETTFIITVSGDYLVVTMFEISVCEHS